MAEDDAGVGGDRSDRPELPGDVADRAERLTRLARAAVDDQERAAYQRERDALLAEHGFRARVRGDDSHTPSEDATLVLYPESWLDDGVVDVDRIEDTVRAVERTLSGPGEDDWDEVEAHNRAVAERVRERHAPVHGETAEAFADFASNHYAKRVERLTREERREFREEYLPRNAWPSDEQSERVERSLELVLAVADEVGSGG